MKVSGDRGRSWPSSASSPQTRRGPELDDDGGGGSPRYRQDLDDECVPL